MQPLPFWYSLLGFVRIRISGDMPERLVNLCLAHGIPLRQLVWRESVVEALVPGRDFRLLRPLAKRARVRVRIIGRHGLPFTWRSLARRRLALALAGLTLVGLYVMSLFVWFVDVTGPFQHVRQEEVRHVLADLGLKPGVFRPAIDRREMARQLVLRLPALAWAYVNFQGTRAVVEIVERTLPPETPPAGPGHLVARRAGVIEEILVLSGEAQVEVGDTVAEGDVLISGLLMAPAPMEQPPAPGAEPPPPQRFAWLQAKGRVLARTWYHDYWEAPLVQEIKTRTGGSARRYHLEVGNREIYLAGPARTSYSHYEVERTARGLDWSLGPVPLRFRLVKTEFFELEVHRRTLPPDRVRQEAERVLRDRVLGAIPMEARIVDVRSEVVQHGEDFIGVRLMVECLEDIGRFMPWTPAEDLPPDAPVG